MFSTTVTQKGQITIPKAFRDFLSIIPYAKVTLMQAKNHIKVYPAKNILMLSGILKKKKQKYMKNEREIMEKEYERI